MKKLLQINVVSNVLSTGKIVEDIAKVASMNDWNCYTAFGRREKPGKTLSFRIGNDWDMYFHYFANKIFDLEGLASYFATKRLIRRIDAIDPDIIHLHNIHDHYLNYPLLFKYFSLVNKPIVWTQHDCWAFTGGCMYFDKYKCERWKSQLCKDCPEKRSLLNNQSSFHLNKRRQVIGNINNMTFVCVSDWLTHLMKSSIYKNSNIVTIHNGIDISLFKPTVDLGNTKKHSILGVSSIWDERKGLSEFVKLRELLPNDYNITLVGLTNKQIRQLPDGITGIKRTTNINELVSLYSNADVFVNPTFSDNFPTTNIEALACGTPVITYNTGGSPEAIDSETGIVVAQGDVVALRDSIFDMVGRDRNRLRTACRDRAENNFDKDKCFSQYLDLYNQLIK